MERKQNKSLAILMLCVVILVGAVLWGVLYTFGWIASIVALLTAYVAIVLYDKFYPVTKNVYIISGVAIVIANIIASFISLCIVTAIDGGYSFGYVLEIAMQAIGDLVIAMAGDIILCIVLTIIGLVGAKKFYENKKARKQKEDEMAQDMPSEATGAETKDAQELADNQAEVENPSEEGEKLNSTEATNADISDGEDVVADNK